MFRIYDIITYLAAFMVQMVKSNIEVSLAVLSPRLNIRPGFLAIPMDARSDLEVTALANSITLTPGTIAIHIPQDRHNIVIHVLDVNQDLDAMRANIKSGLETPLLRITRGRHSRPEAPTP